MIYRDYCERSTATAKTTESKERELKNLKKRNENGALLQNETAREGAQSSLR